MKYAVQIEIDRSPDELAKLFLDRDRLGEWMQGFVGIDQLTGEPFSEGSTARWRFKSGEKEMEMIETVLVSNLPRKYSVQYDAKGVYNLVTTRFEPLNAGRTRVINENLFKFSGFMRIFGLLMPKAFREQSRNYLSDFKELAEKE
jgi:hypothetical protein